MSATIHFSKENLAFWNEMKIDIDRYFTSNKISKKANTAWWLRAVIMLLLFTIPYFIIVTHACSMLVNIICCIIMGIGMAGIGLGISHQASHGTVSKYRFLNKLMSLTFNMLGMSSYLWHIKHDVFHHAYTNIYAKDEALKEGTLFRFTKDTPFLKCHKFQHLYAFFIYAIFTIFWAFALDFEKLWRYNANGSPNFKKHATSEIVTFWITKIYYVAICFIIPFYFKFTILNIACGFLIVHITGSLIITHVLQVEHINTATDLLVSDENGFVYKNWAQNQLEGTANFKCDNIILSWYLAGVNFQIEHHLFPEINAVHYPEISNIIKMVCAKYNLKYIEFSSFGAALNAHYKALKILGNV
jgi:linoleoyl-CoA desaturase